jgi:hypothetical protein
MYDNRPEETKYIYTDDDSQGQQLDGQNTYAVTFAKGQVPPVKGAGRRGSSIRLKRRSALCWKDCAAMRTSRSCAVGKALPPRWRREFMAFIGGAAAVAWPYAASAQRSGKLWRVGFLAGGSRPVALESSVYAGFIRGMRELGYSEGIDFVIEWRFAEGRVALFP